MTVHVPDRFKAANAFWIGLAKIGLTPAAVLSHARLPLTVYDGKKNLVTTAQFFALWRAVGGSPVSRPRTKELPSHHDEPVDWKLNRIRLAVIGGGANLPPGLDLHDLAVGIFLGERDCACTEDNVCR